MDVTRKYEFVDEAEANASIDLLRNEEGNLTQSVVKLGYLTITPAQYDEEGNTIKEAVVSTKYAVDVSAKTYCQLYPESNYCNPPEPDQEQP
jgi:hypothetical protein